MKQATAILADQEFKKAIAHIELHKLRNGEYPVTLRELKFLSATDSSLFNFVEYTRLDTGYELNMKKMEFPSVMGVESSPAQLKYPPEFWKGLGCIRSNTME